MAKTDEVAAISSETIDILESQVKKGKPRKFFMIFKGASIKTLVVFKKGPFGPKVTSAKKAGFKGEVAYGVVTGSGNSLFFQLPGTGEVAAIMKADSDCGGKPPTKKAKLREFLGDNGLSFKPSYHVITDPAQAPDPDSDSATPPPSESEATGEEDMDSATGTTVAAESSDADVSNTTELSTKLAASLKKMKPALDRAIKSDPSRKSELISKMTQFVDEIKNGHFDAARTHMLALGQLIQGIASNAAASPATPTGDGQDRSAIAARLGKELKELKLPVKNAIVVDPTRKAELVAAMTQIAGEIKNQQIEEARNNISAFRDILLDIIEGSGQASASTQDVLAIWRDAKQSVDAQINQLTSALGNSQHPYLREVANLGLQGLAEDPDGVNVRMMATLFDYQNAADDGQRQAGNKILDAIHAYRNFLFSNQVLTVFDTNSVCGPLSIRATLHDALSTIERRLTAVSS